MFEEIECVIIRQIPFKCNMDSLLIVEMWITIYRIPNLKSE